MGGTNDFETLGFLDIRELDAKGFSTAAGATPLGSDAMLSVTGSIGSFDRPAVATELGGTPSTRVDGAAYRPIDFTAGAGTGFATTVSFEEISGTEAKPDFSVIVLPVEKPIEIVVPSAPVNQAPVFATGSAIGTEDSTISGMVVATDADGDSLTVTKLTDPAHGTVTVHADGSFDYAPAANWHGSDSFDVAVSDGKGGTVTGTVTVTATPVNDLPTAGNLSVTTNEDTATGGTLAASDVDGDSLTFSLASGPSHGTASVNASGAWTYTPDAEFFGSDQFTVSVSDGNGGTTSIVVDLTVAAVNDAPTSSDASATVAEDGSVSGTITATDIDGDVLTWSLASAASHGTATVAADGGWTYTPDGDFNGLDSFTATVSDGNGGTRTVTVAVTVTPVNDAPTAGSPSFATNEDIPLTITEAQLLAGASDVDGDALSVVGLSASAGTLSDNGDGTWTLTPTADSSAPITLNWSAADGTVSVPTSATVTVNAVNDAPTAADQSYATDEDIALVGTLTASDVEGDSLTFAKASDPTHGTVTVDADGSFTYVPTADWHGVDSFGFTVSDGNGGTVTKTATITVAPINDAPAVSDVALGSTDEDTAFDFTAADLLAAASDVDLDGLSVTSVTVTSGNGSLTDLGGGSYRFVPAAGWNGQATLSFSVSDGTATTTAEVTLTVDAVNDAPVGDDVSAVTDEDTATDGTLSATDAENDAMSWSLGSGAANGTATVAANGAWTYTPDADWHGSDSFTAIVDDGNGGTDTVTVTVTVNPLNDAPVASGATSGTTDEDTTLTGSVAASDIDGDAVSFAVQTQGAKGTASIDASGDWTYVPDADANGADSFMVRVSDGNGGFDDHVITVTITPINDNPVAGGAANASGNEDTVLTGTVTGTDVDGDTVSFSVQTQGAKGSVTVDGSGNWTYTPSANATGADSFTIRIGDGNGGFADHTVSVTLSAVNDAPTAGNLAVTISEDGTASGTLTATDVDGDGLSWSLTASATHGTVTVDADGAWNYEPDADFAGSDQFTATVSDGHGGTATVTIDVTVTAVNDAPVVADVALGSTDEDTAFDFTAADLLVGASDVDLDAMSVDSVTVASGSGTVNDLGGGNFRFVPAAGWNGQVVLSFGISDGTIVTNAQATLTVTAVNDAPTAADQGFSTNEDATLNGTLTASDVDGDSLTFSKATDPAHGTVTINASGTFTYVPAANWNGMDSFDFTVDDGNGGIVTKTATVTVNPVLDAPTGVAIDDAHVAEASFGAVVGTLSILCPDPTDGMTMALDASSFSGSYIRQDGYPVAMPLELVGDVLKLKDGYAFDYELSQAASIQVRVTDTLGVVRTYTLNLTVDAVNEAPITSGLSQETGVVNEDGGQAADWVYASDPEGAAVTFAKVSNPANGTATMTANGYWTYTPNANFSGTDSFTYTASDPAGNSITRTINVTVNPVADAPNAALADASGTEDTAIALDFTGTGLTDVSETLTVQISGLPADATLSAGTDLGGGVWRLTATQLAGLTVTAPTPGSYSLTLTATSTESNGATATASDTASLTVSAGNAAPTASDANIMALKDNPVAFKLRASDPDGNPLTESLHTAPGHGTVAWDAGIGEWLYTPDAGYSGADSFIMQVSDGNGGTATSTYNVQVRSESTGLTVNAERDVVNYDSGTTNRPAIAADSDGSYAVFAADYNVAGNLVFFGADGTPTGVNINVKPGTGTFGGDTDIAYFKDGSHRVIIVKGDESATTDGNDWGVSISVYGEDGTAVATNVVPYDPAVFANRQYDIGLAALEGANAGKAIVTFQCRYKAGWTYDTWGVVVNSDGTYATPFQINAATTNAYESDVAALSNGGFVAAYEAPDANSTGVYMRFFDSAFAATSGDVAVNTTTAGYQGRPEIAASSSGVVVTWASADNQLRMRTFDTSGNATSAEIVVGSQDRYRWWDVAAYGNEYCVVWEAADSNGTGVWMQRFSMATGASLAAASLVASSETGTQARPDVDYTGDGSLVFAYDDGSVTKIRTRSQTQADNTVAFVGTDGGDAAYGSSGADDFQGGLGNDVFFSGGGADVIRFSSILDGEETLDSVDFTQGASINLTGILTAGQIDASHIRLRAVSGTDDAVSFEVDHDQDGSWDRLALLTNAKEATGAMDGDGNFDAVSQAQLDTALQGLIDGGQITA